MPYTKLLVHLVWATKCRKPLLKKAQMERVKTHMREYAKTKNIHLIHVNGWLDHVHCLVSISPDQSISNIVNLLKGESSFWLNKNRVCSEKFGWQNEYFAISIGPSQLDVVYNYIDRQEIHHAKKSFEQEYNEIVAALGLDKEKA